MPEILTFDHAMIETYLQAREYRYLRDQEGDYRVEFSYNEDRDCALKIWLIVSGTRRQIYHVWIWAEKRIRRDDWDRALRLCNTWNKENRWPKAYLHVNDPATDATGEIRLEENIDLEKGIHQELFDDWTDTAIATASNFWKWIHQEHGL